MWQFYNPNPAGKRVGDCTVRAISKATGQTWEKTYMDLCLQGYIMGDMPTANAVWGAYLKSKGFKQHVMPDTCPECYTVAEFCRDYPTGTYILAISGHVVAIENGTSFDSWDSQEELPVYYWQREDGK